MFPLMLAGRLLDIYTHSKDQVVFDPFLGSGTTIIAARQRGMQSVGFEQNPAYVRLAIERIEQIYYDITVDMPPYTIHNESSMKIVDKMAPDSVDITVTSPPYWDVLNQKRSQDGKEIRNYGNSEDDLGAIDSYRCFIDALKLIFSRVEYATKPGGYVIVIVMDLRKGGVFYPFHIDVQLLMKSLGFSLNDIFIWNRKKEYNSLGPLGYPSKFIVNKIHEYILVFQKGNK